MQVADIADVVRQQADALMLCGETAAGQFPDKCVGVLRAVATSIEEWCRSAPRSLSPADSARSWPQMGDGQCLAEGMGTLSNKSTCTKAWVQANASKTMQLTGFTNPLWYLPA